jgi:hypothetical protein
MPEPKGNDVQQTLAVRVTPDYHAQLSMVAQVDEMSLTDLVMTALDKYMTSRRESEDFKAKVQKALEDAEAQMARTRAMLLGALLEGAPSEPGTPAPAAGRGRWIAATTSGTIKVSCHSSLAEWWCTSKQCLEYRPPACLQALER